ncbi:MAG: hypothetical protein ACOH1Q_10240 [Thiobacillus sp.]
MKLFTCLAAAGLAVWSWNATADLLVHYDNPVKNGSSIGFDSSIPHSPVHVAPLTVASPLTNSGVQGVNHMEAYQTNDWSAAATPDPTKYITFSVTPDTDYQLHIDRFDIDLWQSLGQYQVQKFALRWNGDSFSSDLISSAIQIVTANPTNSSYSFSLAGLDTRTTITEFRLYFYDVAEPELNTALISMGTIGNGISLYGSVSAVPEPSQLGLTAIGLALVTFVARSSKRRNDLA